MEAAAVAAGFTAADGAAPVAAATPQLTSSVGDAANAAIFGTNATGGTPPPPTLPGGGPPPPVLPGGAPSMVPESAPPTEAAAPEAPPAP